ncbi:FadR/GntR family transcriptional regulator [Actinospica sp.]|jgi:DNA-binding FadR family transcriptional regulator|uniref:FadR/GntR family transcriptional regulator n=1 Tax=Actinospica sp. TaxID=1872142 RepID=UPI002CF73781|nr:FCD domain-containing protein [Actinospica sp.]HWG28654.1 FCD domain-containing protein [Actinospica sp.]
MNKTGKFGPYSATGHALALPGPGAQSGAELVRSRIALHVALATVRPGDRLPDVGVLAEQLGIGEMTVRRALEGMCQDGLLDRRRGRTGGTFVSADWSHVAAAHHDAEGAASIAGFLLLLECGLVAHASGEVDDEQLAGLRKLAEDLDATADPDRLREVETRFHLDLAEALGGRGMREVTADLLGRLCLLRPAAEPDTIRRQNLCHVDLLVHLTEGATDAAVRAVKEHM